MKVNVHRLAKGLDAKLPGEEDSHTQRGMQEIKQDQSKTNKYWKERLSRTDFCKVQDQLFLFVNLFQQVHSLSVFNSQSSVDLLLDYAAKLTRVSDKVGFASSKSGFFSSKTSSSDKHKLEISWNWSNSFNSSYKSRPCSSYSVTFELFSVLFNVSVCYSQLALRCDTSSTEGLKEAARLLLQSAGVFQYLLSPEFSPDYFSLDSVSDDISKPVFLWLTEYLHAQATLFTLQLGIEKGLPPGTLAKLAKGCHSQFDKARGLSVTLKGVHKSVLSTQKSISLGLDATAEYYQSLVCNQEGKYGEQIARLERAKGLLEQAEGICAGMSSSEVQISGFIEGMVSTVSSILLNAARDNRSIYMMPVPSQGQLSQVESRILGKPSKFAVIDCEESYLVLLDKVSSGSVRGADTTNRGICVADETKVMQLVGMGFQREASTVALGKCGNDVDRALDVLDSDVGKVEDRDPFWNQSKSVSEQSEEEEEKVDKRSEVSVEEMVTSFEQMGFSKVKAREALEKSNNDFEVALFVLSTSAPSPAQPSHPPPNSTPKPKPKPNPKPEQHQVKGVDPSLLSQLVSMGFPQDASISALITTHNKLEHAITLLAANKSDYSSNPNQSSNNQARPKPKESPPMKKPALSQSQAKKQLLKEYVQQLVFLGFTQSNAERALLHTDNDFEAALNKLSGDQEEEERKKVEMEKQKEQQAKAKRQQSPPPEERAAQASDIMKLGQLMSMGFSQDASRKALAKANNDIEQALLILTE